MKIKTLLLTLTGIAFIMTLTGCGSLMVARPHPVSVGNGSLMGAVTYPNQVMGHTQFQITSNDFEIIGSVSATGKSLGILGMIAVGDNGYSQLWDKARKMGADDVINVRVDTRVSSVLGGFVFRRASILLSGTAIRWKNKVVVEPAPAAVKPPAPKPAEPEKAEVQ
jgi:hypothetical protein